MPGTPKPLIDPRYGPHWTPLVQALQLGQQRTSALAAGAMQGNLVDQYGNTVEVAGTNLNQVVTIGASYGRAGVLVGTGIASGVAGRAVQANLALGTITVSAGTAAATLNSVSLGAFISGMVIGAADVSDPTSGLATSAIPPFPATTFTISGTAITLSQPAVESGTGIVCAACNWVLVT